jgi:formylglycine-generating enzyme required for sulfatase activity
MRLLAAVAAASSWLWLASAAGAVTIEWVTVGDPGNACDTQAQGCFGAVANAYRISKYEITNAQYAEFLNAKAKSDPLGLYSADMSGTFGGITRIGSDPNYSYSVITGRGDLPVVAVSFYAAMRFANWLNNGQGLETTESGAYTLLGGTAIPSNGTTVTRNANAQVFIPTEDEWYKAAYYDPNSSSYYDYAAGTDTHPECSTPTSLANHANCFYAVSDATAVGTYTGSSSPNGTFDQGGNVEEWNETIFTVNGNPFRGIRGGSFNDFYIALGASAQSAGEAATQYAAIGFRVASPGSAPPPSAVPSLEWLGAAVLGAGLMVAGLQKLRA